MASTVVAERSGASGSGSALRIALHPLVILTISDHFTRAKFTAKQPQVAPRIVGALLGQQKGREVEIANCFELVVNDTDNSVDFSYLKKKQEQFKKVYPDYEILGWYTTGTSPKPSDMQIHKQMLDINENPLLLLLDSEAAYNVNTKDLSLYLYESELHMVDQQPVTMFVSTNYTIATAEAERIGVDHVAHLKAEGQAGSQLTSQLQGMMGAIKMLNLRVKALLKFVEATRAGNVPYDHALMRQISSLCCMLPALNSPEFTDEFLREYNDGLLVAYLSTLTKTINTMNEVADKYSATQGHGLMRGHMFY